MMEERGGRGRQKPLEICDVAIQCLVWGASSSLSADQGTTSVWGQDKIERASYPMTICIATMRLPAGNVIQIWVEVSNY